MADNQALGLLSPCRVCPRQCGADRSKQRPKKLGFCQAGRYARVFSAHPHHGEEKCLSGWKGSGTIFFSSCNLACVYCQNWEISQKRLGNEVKAKELAEMMLSLQDQGCHNINFVSPSIWVPQILEAVTIAKDKGLELSLVYNTGGYDAVKSLKLLQGVIDIYMPDIKYADSQAALKYSLVPNYWQVVRKAVKEMYRQVGDLVVNKDGLAEKGLLIRHLVLPNGLAGTEKVMQFISAQLSKNTYVNLMDQYYPSNKAGEYPKINRRLTEAEWQQAVVLAKRAGLYRLDG